MGVAYIQKTRGFIFVERKESLTYWGQPREVEKKERAGDQIKDESGGGRKMEALKTDEEVHNRSDCQSAGER